MNPPDTITITIRYDRATKKYHITAVCPVERPTDRQEIREIMRRIAAGGMEIGPSEIVGGAHVNRSSARGVDDALQVVEDVGCTHRGPVHEGAAVDVAAVLAPRYETPIPCRGMQGLFEVEMPT